MPPLKPAALALAGGLAALALSLPLLLGIDGSSILGLDVEPTFSESLPPPPTLRLLSPETGQGVATSVHVAGEATSAKSAILDVQYRLDGTSWASLPRVVGGARVVPFAAELPVPDGDHLLEVRAYDGHAFSPVERALLRASPHGPPPTVRILQPAEGEGLPQGTVVMRGTVEAQGTARVVVNASGREVEALVTSHAPGLSTWSASFDLPGGLHVLSARAGDGLPRSVRVALAPEAPPTLRILAPANGSTYGSAGDPACPAACILFSGVAPGAAEILVSLDDAEPVPLSRHAPGTYTRTAQGAWTFALPTARLLSGEHRAAFTPVAPDGAQGAPQEVPFALRNGLTIRIAGDDAPRPTRTPLDFALEGERVAEARWLLDGEEVGSGLSVQVRLATPGAHALTALTRDAQGRAATARLPLHALNQPPLASLELPGRPLSGEVRLVAQAHDVDGRVATFHWDFGDGETLTTDAGIASHLYARPGVFRVNLTAYDDHGTPSPKVGGPVTVVNAPPVAAFSWSPASPTLREPVTFADESLDAEGRIAALRWDFGDGATAEGALVAHAFATRGAHEVTLTAVDGEGARSTRTRTVHVGNLPPTVAFVHEPQAIQTGAEVLFLDRSVKHDGRIVSWAWDFGHDCPEPCSPLEARAANGSSVLHAFPAPGLYRVNLTVTDDFGAPASRSLDVLVSDGLPRVQRVVLDPAEPRGMEEVRFKALARDPEGAPLDHEWSFGDGAASFAAEPTHRYARGGVYEARLRLTDAAGQTSELSFPVLVANARPNATLAIPLGAYAGRVALLEANATDPDGRVVRHRFDADGDGIPDCDGPEPRCAFTYPRAGTYHATLAVADDEGASVLLEFPVDVRLAPDHEVSPVIVIDTPAPSSELQGRVLLSGAASGPRPIAKVEAQLRNAQGTLSAARDPWMLAAGNASWRLHLDTRVFPDGAYDVVLRATDARGVVGTSVLPVVVANGPRESLVGLTLLDAPTAPLRADHEMRGSAWHPDGPVSVRHRLDEGPWRDAPGPATGFTLLLPARELGPGPHVLQVDARHGLLDRRVETVAFRVADAPPVLVVDEPPTHIAYGLLATSGRLVGDGRVQWRLDHDVWRDLPAGPEWRLAHETFGIEGGMHTLWLKPVSLDGVEEGEPVKYRVRVINPTGKTPEDERLLEELRRPAPEPGAVDLEEVARGQREVPLGAWTLPAALLLALLGAGRFAPPRSRY